MKRATTARSATDFQIQSNLLACIGRRKTPLVSSREMKKAEAEAREKKARKFDYYYDLGKMAQKIL